jgi:hypothetical protein
MSELEHEDTVALEGEYVEPVDVDELARAIAAAWVLLAGLVARYRRLRDGAAAE